MADLRLTDINKIYPNGVHAVIDFNMIVEHGEFIVLVGPSGCGKSTTLRMIAGLEEISSGDLIIGQNRVNDKAPVDRDIAMVFQNYALYNHMTSYDNVGIGLRIRHENSNVQHLKIMEASEILGLDDYLNRKPKQLSGGQRQRVALGRTIVRDPKVFLMDEPLSNLDAKLRGKTRKEIVKLHKELDATFVYVTHDQVEAMTMATRMVVMNEGYVQQIGTPYDVYNKPENVFVGSFIGTPPMNFIEGKVKDDKFYFVVEGKEVNVVIPEEKRKVLRGYSKEKVLLGIRPEDTENTQTLQNFNPDFVNEFTITHSELLGHQYIINFEVQGSKFTSLVSSEKLVANGTTIELEFNMNKCHFFDIETEMRLRKVD